MKKIIKRLFSTSAGGFYLLFFAFAIGVATFIENDFGTSAAQKLVFKARWFEVLLVLFGLCILNNIIQFRMIQQKKWGTAMFHFAVLIILLGAGVTRYFGFEGIMHIREDLTSDEIISSETHLLFEAEQNGKTYRFDEQVLFASLGKNNFHQSYQIGKDIIDVELDDFIPNPETVFEQEAGGDPILKVVIAGQGGREEYYLRQGEFKNLRGNWFNFGNPEQPQAVNIYYRNDSLVFNVPSVMTQMVMATQQTDTIYPGSYQPLRVRSLYSNERLNFVIGEFSPAAQLVLRSAERKMKNESFAALKMTVKINDQPNTIFVYGKKGLEGKPEIVTGGNTRLSVAYGAKRIKLPFSLKLRDFILDKYPGTNSASSYASEVTLIDPEKGINREQRIYMNNVLDHRGYRFFQSSFDQDELGTVLSVNHDWWGTWISYIGYFLLTIGLVMMLFTKNSRFLKLSERLKEMRLADKAGSASGVVLLFLMSLSGVSLAQGTDDGPVHVFPKHHAEAFGKILVQDQKGRIKPMNTMSSEILRKISRRESLFGLSADQVMLGMTLYPEEWITQPVIKTGKHEEVKKLFPGDGYATFNDFFTEDGQYRIRDLVKRAYSLQPIDRSMLDKEIMKIDERVNICNMVFSGSIARLYPIPGHPEQLWYTAADAFRKNDVPVDDFVRNFFKDYAMEVQAAFESKDWSAADQQLAKLVDYQQANGGDILISKTKVNMEILLNKMNVFSRLSKAYGLLGLLFLSLFFAKAFKPSLNIRRATQVSFYLLAFCFLAHTLGLAIRWYVSGRAPWSNGYESMIYIGFTTVLAGLLFSRKSLGGLTATSILASTILMVAGLSWLDPEITPLVPVLKSYWLTIHVSLEAGSYGFLMLGAIIGLLNLALMIFLTKDNQTRIFRTITEMSHISEMTLIGGLIMVSVGTYLGGIWANESWGRYWGWDAKETWALVTTLVYAFILHMRFIPGLRGPYAFSVASLFGFASVMMTYLGVNYYLSGLHSYAAGDPVPIPASVYYTAGVFIVISLLGYWKYRQFKPSNRV